MLALLHGFLFLNSWFGSLQIVSETLPALVKLKEKGIVRNIGIAGLPLKIFQYVLDRAEPGSVDVVLSYCHHTLFDNTLMESLPYLSVCIAHTNCLSFLFYQEYCEIITKL